MGIIPIGLAFISGVPLFSSDLIFFLAVAEVILFFLILITAWGASFLPKYIPMILASSACGFFVSLLYAYLKAPDLAMTQLCVETLSTIMFLVVIMKLRNKEAVRPENKAAKTRNLLIALCCSFVLFMFLMGADLAAPFESFSHYFMDKGIEFTGGRNIVNVIVVDFRGYDTLGEISVLAIAALTVYNLIQSRVPKKSKTDASKDAEAADFKTDSEELNGGEI